MLILLRKKVCNMCGFAGFYDKIKKNEKEKTLINKFQNMGIGDFIN